MPDFSQDRFSSDTNQRVFRQLMKAFSYPGTRQEISQNKGMQALQDVLSTLIDGGVGLADLSALLNDDDWSRLEAKNVMPEAAHFVLADGDATFDFIPMLGTLDAPEAGATIILSVANLSEGIKIHLSGPGIEQSESISVSGLHPKWLQQRSEWNANYPKGVDILFVDDIQVIALPRTTRIALEGEE